MPQTIEEKKNLLLTNKVAIWDVIERYNKYALKKTGMEAYALPSTSPANAAYSLDKLKSIYATALRE